MSYISRLPLVNRLTAGFRSATPPRIKDPREDEIQRKLCTWAKEVLLSLHNNITLPNLPKSLSARFLSSNSPSIPHQRTLFADALYNSTLSLSNRHTGATLPKRILSCAIYALSLSPPPPLTKKEILRRLCTAASQKTRYARTRRLGPDSWFLKNKTHCYLPSQNAHGPSSHSRSTEQQSGNPTGERYADNICTLLVLGMEDRAIELLDAAASVHVSDVFGRVGHVAGNWGRAKVVEWFERVGDTDTASRRCMYMHDTEWLDQGARPCRDKSVNPADEMLCTLHVIPDWLEAEVLHAIASSPVTRDSPHRSLQHSLLLAGALPTGTHGRLPIVFHDSGVPTCRVESLCRKRGRV
ncbi:hypothetical protein P171DRAFT_483105 [Karstenula rhodostoma CBS 690.94]|uniref:Uncharacterized protein n=1 Tax=Karstenula rhodostoma CBS 690.94 TaxID=1392251 RepID=A0A9P4PQB0_9PLEO|nr:hypothetical protein P171DRAFT_483105 [Karstenula rhodostoma CBS 690.94]